MMDLCNGLKVFPLHTNDLAPFCQDHLKLAPAEPVPVLEFLKYMAYVKQAGKEVVYAIKANETALLYPRDSFIYLLP